MIDVKELRTATEQQKAAMDEGEERELPVEYYEEILELLDDLEAAATLAEKLKTAVSKHGCVWVKPYYSEYKEMLVLLDNYRAARGK